MMLLIFKACHLGQIPMWRRGPLFNRKFLTVINLDCHLNVLGITLFKHCLDPLFSFKTVGQAPMVSRYCNISITLKLQKHVCMLYRGTTKVQNNADNEQKQIARNILKLTSAEMIKLLL